MEVDCLMTTPPRELIKSGNRFNDETKALKALQEIKAILKKYED